MDRLQIAGGTPLAGEVRVSGAKNAALPILCAALLDPEPVVVDNVPRLRDVDTTLRLLETMGATCERDGERIHVDCGRIDRLGGKVDLQGGCIAPFVDHDDAQPPATEGCDGRKTEHRQGAAVSLHQATQPRRRAGNRMDVGRIDELACQSGRQQETEIAEHHPEPARGGLVLGQQRGTTPVHAIELSP